jgi:hypothetical protein
MRQNRGAPSVRRQKGRKLQENRVEFVRCM